MVARHYSWRDMNQCPFTLDSKLMTDQCKDTHKVQHSEPMNITQVTCRNMSERLLIEAETTQS